MGWLQAHFFVQFAEHGLFWGFSPVNATLRKLPAVGAYALSPEYLVLLVEQDDADVRPKAVPVKHNQTPKSLIAPIMHASLHATRESFPLARY